MKFGIIVLVAMALLVSGCVSGSQSGSQQNPTVTTGPTQDNSPRGPTAMPYPEGTFTLSAHYTTPMSQDLSFNLINDKYPINDIEGIAWWTDGKLVKTYYHTSPGGRWYSHTPGDDISLDRLVDDPLELSYSSLNRAKSHEVYAWLYGFAKNSDRGNVCLGRTNNVTINPL